MPVRFAKLIAHVGRYAWFDAAGAQTNQRQSYYEHRSLSHCNSPRGGHARECEVAKAVSDRKGKDCPILADPTICDDCAKNREEIDAENKIMGVHVRLVRVHRRQHTRLIQNVMRHKDGQNRLHAVIREALGRFVADDVWHAWRHRADIWW